MSVLVDTNVLLRRMQPHHPMHRAAMESVARLLSQGEILCITPQNISEFWNVATRPVANNGLGLTPEIALREVETLERILNLLPDGPNVYLEWKQVVSLHRVSGVQVHDARLVAAMRAHGVARLLTFDVDDFARYGIEVIDPKSLA